MRQPPRARILAVLAVAIPVLAACDTNDGRELDPPTAPAPVTTVPVTDPVVIDTFPDDAAPTTAVPAGFRLVTSWRDGAPVPARHTCDGTDVSPALSWTGVPVGTVQLALVVTDDDAGGFVHWVVTGIDPSVVSLAEGALPVGTVVHGNDFGVAAWRGPCPPSGEAPHSYRFTLHALNQPLVGADEITTSEVISLIEQQSLDQVTVFGTYARG